MMIVDTKLKGLCDEIVRIADPVRVILFSFKQDTEGNLSSVKLCVIIKGGDSRLVEQKLYVEIDSELPFDVLVYTRDEWDELIRDDMGFAARINSSGRVLHAAD